MRTLPRLAAVAAAALVAGLGLTACIQMPTPPSPQTSQDGGDPGDQSGPAPTIGADGAVSDELAEQLYLTYVCPRNARIADFNAALDAADVDETVRLARETLDIVQNAHAAFSNPDLVWPATLQGPVDQLLAGLELEQQPLQVAIDADSEADLLAVDFTASTDAFGTSGAEYRAALGMDPEPSVACGY